MKTSFNPQNMFICNSKEILKNYYSTIFPWLERCEVKFGFRNLASHQAGLREIFRVLKPGGEVALLEFSHVCTPIVGPLFRIYFRWVLPRLGAWISGVDGPYKYLPDSVGRFPDQAQLRQMMRDCGFISVRYRNFFGGVASLHRGRKPG